MTVVITDAQRAIAIRRLRRLRRTAAFQHALLDLVREHGREEAWRIAVLAASDDTEPPPGEKIVGWVEGWPH